jgi:signal transduction histidine kinase
MERCLTDIAEMAGQTVEEVRIIARALRPYQLDSLGLTRALQALVRQVADANNLEMELNVTPIDGALSPSAEMNVYRILQEVLNNVVRHAHATRLRVLVERSDQIIRILVQDNGCGFDSRMPSPTGNGGFGLRGIQERLQLLNGRWHLQSQPGSGTQIRIEIPAEANARP